MKYLQLKCGSLAMVDDEDFQSLSQYSWSICKKGRTSYAIRWNKGKRVRMHRDILQAKEGDIVDHKDGNGLNNTKGNIRLCSHTENMRNQFKRRVGVSSRFKGVSFHKTKNRWESSIGINSKHVYLGRFNDENAAARAYNAAATKYFGEFAQLNPV
jgi:hypothetical protein